MNEYDRVRCPKCGHQSENNEICDACGAVFSKVREREYAGEVFQARTGMAGEELHGSGASSSGRILFLLVLFFIVAAGGIAAFWIWRTIHPQTVDELINAHRQIVRRARQVLADEIEEQKQLPAHKQLYIETLDLAASITKMSEQPGQDDETKVRLTALTEANNRLAELLNMTVEEFTATATKMGYQDPFAEVDAKINIAQNPELAKKASNPLLDALDLLRGRRANRGQ